MRTTLASLIALSFLASCLLTSSVQARPLYLTVFKKTYPNIEAAAVEQKCEICHPEKDKKVRNDYAKAVGEKLGATNVKVDEKIKAALTEAEPGKSAIEGKTYGDLIKADKLPNATE